MSIMLDSFELPTPPPNKKWQKWVLAVSLWITAGASGYCFSTLFKSPFEDGFVFMLWFCIPFMSFMMGFIILLIKPTKTGLVVGASIFLLAISAGMILLLP